MSSFVLFSNALEDGLLISQAYFCLFSVVQLPRSAVCKLKHWLLREGEQDIVI